MIRASSIENPALSIASRIYDFDGFGVESFQVGELVSAELGINQNGTVLVLLL